MSLADAEQIAHAAQHELGHALPNLDAFDIVTTVGDGAASRPHTH
jgi:predicted Zn-dependent protease